MSSTYLAYLRAVERSMRLLDRHVRATYGDDGARYPRDFYRPADRRNLASVPGRTSFLP